VTNQYPGYQPLEEVVCFDDFDNGLNGWMTLTPNFRQDVFDYFPSQRRHIDWGNPMLSNATFPYAGTHGSRHGTYSMKIATRPVAARARELPVAGSLGIGMKRLTIPKRQLLRIEMYFVFKPEQDRPGMGDTDVRAFGFTWDVQDSERRYFPGFRYVNAADGKMQQRWQYLRASEGSDEDWGEMGTSAISDNGKGEERVFIKRGLGSEHLGRRDDHGGGDGFVDIPGGQQELCYNETPDKLNWQYLAFTIDLWQREYVELHAVDRVFDLHGLGPNLVDPYPRISQLLNPLIWIESDTNRRVFLFVDSVLISTGARS
jgi:hypothetical protein